MKAWIFFALLAPRISLAIPMDDPYPHHAAKANCDLKVTAPNIAANPRAIPYSTPARKKIEIDAKMLGGCFALTTQLKFKDFRFNKKEMQSVYDQDDFFTYLKGFGRPDDPSARVDYASGHEQELKKWLLTQPDNSIDPVSLYAKSLELSKGNVFNGMLTIHQFLRNEARFWDKRRYCYVSDSKTAHRVFNKLIDIRGDLKERGQGFYGDHEGSWYRIFGVIVGLLSQVDERQFQAHDGNEKPSGAMCSDDDPEEFGQVSNRVFNALARAKLAHIEGTKDSDLESDQRKYEINVKALDAAENFYYELLHKRFTADQGRCESREYLKIVQP